MQADACCTGTFQVRLVFSGAVQSGEGGGGAGAPRSLLRSTGSASYDTDTDTQSGRARAVISALENVVEEQTTEISQICGCVWSQGRPTVNRCLADVALTCCTAARQEGEMGTMRLVSRRRIPHTCSTPCRANAEEIARSMLELGGMAGGAAELRSGLSEADSGLQAVGAQYAKRLEELQDLRSTQSNMAAARQVPVRPVGCTGQCSCKGVGLTSNCLGSQNYAPLC